MILTVEKSKLSGQVEIPASKSHTVRAVAIGSLASGAPRLANPLVSADTLSAVETYRGFGASITTDDEWVIKGVGGHPTVPENVLDVGNSGTTLYIGMGTAALIEGYSIFTGDEQIRSRPVAPLLDALKGLGVEGFSTNESRKPPVVIKGPLLGGQTKLDGSKTSQYLTSLLINCPLAQGDSEIVVSNAIERPYIEMTLKWLEDQGIRCERNGFEEFHIPGNQRYHEFQETIPGDFSSATFFLCAAAITGAELTLHGLDMNDPQGDKAVVEMLQQMGAKIEQVDNGIRIKGGELKAGEFDLSNTPDALPAMAVTACFAEGKTRLFNVAQARLKETDRICVMQRELTKMGAEVAQHIDGLVIEGRPLHAGKVNGHADHRIVMALAIAGLACEGITEIDTAEAVSVTFPTFVDLMQSTGARMKIQDAV